MRKERENNIMAPQKSTNVRITIRATKLALRLLPASWAGTIGARLFLGTPPRRKSSSDEKKILQTGDELRVRSGGEELKVWRFGVGPAILLVHGWGGSGAQLSCFIEPLLEAGFSVITFDGPGHGQSSGRIASLVHLGTAILDIAKSVGPIHGVIAHSVGAAATSIAVDRGLELERAVFIGPPADAAVWFEKFAATLELTDRAKEAARERVENLVGVDFDQLNADAIGWPRSIELLVIHDRNDREVPFSDGEKIVRIADGKLAATDGLGHRRILSDPTVISTALLFFASTATSLQETINRELFDRWARPAA
jgi:pimeloyl-ACP methyl ester carboxylesterase